MTSTPCPASSYQPSTTGCSTVAGSPSRVPCRNDLHLATVVVAADPHDQIDCWVEALDDHPRPVGQHDPLQLRPGAAVVADGTTGERGVEQRRIHGSDGPPEAPARASRDFLRSGNGPIGAIDAARRWDHTDRMSTGFHDGSRELQDRFDTRALADRIDELLVGDTIGDGDRAFIEARDMFFLATADAEGRPTCSYKGGEPGFVRVLDPHTLAFPNYDGNGMYLSMGNVLVHPDVGMLFIDFEQGHRMRLEGTASIDLDDPLRGDYPEAQFVVRVRARAVYPNCPRYIHRYQLVRAVALRAATDCLTPVPEWKRSDWAADALPANDPARDPGERDVIGR